jgi:hypothetical protein
VDISDELSTYLDKFCELAGTSRSGVLEVLIRDRLYNLIKVVGNLPENIREGKEDVTLEEVGDGGEAEFLESVMKYAKELDLFVRVFGLTNIQDRK